MVLAKLMRKSFLTMWTRLLIGLLGLTLGLLAVPDAKPSTGIRYGIQDDAWLLGGPGSYASRLSFLKGLGIDVVRVNIRWDDAAVRRPTRATRHTDRADRWGAA